MGGDIIADKFALLKTRGSNGVCFTHFVEDTLLGQRAVVKVSDKLEDLGLDYLKAVNLARESGIPGMLMPFEGGILEEEAGYYLAFPELGEPSLEDYLRMGAPLTCREVLEISDGILAVLQDLHQAGFVHLFLDARNVFYRPGRGVTLKDPALRQEFFHLFLELITAPDFYFFSPGVMDGGMPGWADDLYAAGRIAERLLERAADARSSPYGALAAWLARRCCEASAAGGAASAGEIRRELAGRRAAAEAGGTAGGSNAAGPECARDSRGREGPAAPRPRPRGHGRAGAGRKLWTAIALSLLLALPLGVALMLMLSGEGVRAPALARSGGSHAGVEMPRGMSLRMRERPSAGVSAAVSGGDGELAEAPGALDAGGAGSPTVSTSGEEGWEAKAESPLPTAPAPAPAPSPSPPVASFSVSPGEGQSPLQVYLDASGSYDPDGSIVSYAWSCGGSGVRMYHVIESSVIPATVTITLTVTDDAGHTASCTRCVTLY